MTRDELKALLAPLPDVSILGLTLYGEARGEPIEGIVAVAHVVNNRRTDAKSRWPKTFREACLQKYQFSCWNPKDPNRATLAALARKLLAKQPTPELDECAWVALGIEARALRDNSHGANHYHAVSLVPRPSWAQAHIPVTQIKRHLFYAL
jgi:N-acetylmuramoyl-L-alanine amidase